MSERSSVGDLLAAEFADVSAVGRRIPRPSIAASSVPWAILAAFGAALLTSDLVRVFLSLVVPVQRTVEVQLPTTFEMSAVASTAVGLAVAWRAGGPVAVEGYAAILALERVLGLTRLLRFCAGPQLERFAGTPLADRCTLEGQLIQLWPLAAGALVAVLLVRAVARSRARSNGAFEAAGAFALTQSAWSALLGLVGPDTTVPGTSPDVAFTIAMAVSIAVVGGIAAGLVLARRSSRPWRAYAVISAVLLVFYAQFTLRSFAYGFAAGGLSAYGINVIAIISPLLVPVAAAIALSVSRSRLAPT
jgi:hypothetical protein